MRTTTIFAPLVVNLMQVAEDLSAPRSQKNLQQAAWRRAVSSAYYAVFHALCSICADELVGFGKSDLLEPIYRSLDHGPTAGTLLANATKSIDPAIKTIADNFKTLQLERHNADYKPPEALYQKDQVRALIDTAHETLSLMSSLDQQAKLQLAILLVAGQRNKRQGSA